jgi:hypothetical protein
MWICLGVQGQAGFGHMSELLQENRRAKVCGGGK